MDCETVGDVCSPSCGPFSPMGYEDGMEESNLQPVHFDDEGIAGYIHRDRNFSLFSGDCDIRTNKSIFLAESGSMEPAACCQIEEISLD